MTEQKQELQELRKLQKETNRFFSKTEWKRLKELEVLEKGNRL